MVITRGRRGQIYGDETELDLGGENTMQYAGDVLQNCTLTLL